LRKRPQFHDKLQKDLRFDLFPLLRFLATKLEAFKDRSHDDFMGSSDIEDVIAVLDGRPEIFDEIRDSPSQVKNFLVRTFAALLEEEAFLESLPGYVKVRSESPERISILLERVRAMASMEIEDFLTPQSRHDQ
jgi:hypothetical protein